MHLVTAGLSGLSGLGIATMDPRYNALARTLCRYSMQLNKTDKVLIDTSDIPDEMVVALLREARACGATATAESRHPVITRELVAGGNDEQFKATAKYEMERMKGLTAYVAIRGFHNMFQSSDVPNDKMTAYLKAMKPVLNQRVNKTKWVVLRWPTHAMAQAAKMSTEAFADYYFRVCTLDYSRMLPGAKALEALMRKTDRVEIKGPGETHLKFSIKNIGAEKCVGQRNIPDGEVFSCPVKESVEGVLQYNTPTEYRGSSFENVRLEFKKGKIVKANCGSGDEKKLNAILDSDPGARYIGEFAIGFNPYVHTAICDILFDEKIAGSFHFTPGQCYETASNGNDSQVHWDMVGIQRPEYGGGEIWFDGRLIRKDGLFVPAALQKLNPDYLLGKGK